jgi:hypothetical protein
LVLRALSIKRRKVADALPLWRASQSQWRGGKVTSRDPEPTPAAAFPLGGGGSAQVDVHLPPGRVVEKPHILRLAAHYPQRSAHLFSPPVAFPGSPARAVNMRVIAGIRRRRPFTRI